MIIVIMIEFDLISPFKLFMSNYKSCHPFILVNYYYSIMDGILTSLQNFIISPTWMHLRLYPQKPDKLVMESRYNLSIHLNATIKVK